MKRKSLKTIWVILSMLTISILIMACQSSNKETSKQSQDEELTYWVNLPANTAATVTNLGETPFAQELEKRTGIKVKYLHPPQGQAKEQFNLMLASGELPDMVEMYWTFDYPGGPNKAIKDGNIITLNDVINENAPNLKKYLTDNPDIDSMVKVNEGDYYLFPFIRGDDFLLLSAGLIIRNDWLKELELQMPETIEEWEITLEIFKDKKGAEAPLVLTTGNIKSDTFMGAYGIGSGFYHINGKMKYGAIEPGYKDFLITFKRWYDKGLLDKNFPTVNSSIVDSSILNGRSGATYASLGGGLGRYLMSMADKDSDYDLIGVPYPVLNKGDKRSVPIAANNFFHQGTAITKNCKNVELAAKYLDYSYGEDGHMLNNFGIEGESYTMVDGYPKYTDIILNNPEGLSVNYAMGRYFRASSSGPFVQDKRYMEQYITFDQQRDTLDIWFSSDADKDKKLPPFLPTIEEAQELSQIMNDVKTYEDEMLLKFITGIESLGSFDKYVNVMKELKIERAIEIQQTALDRYRKR